MLHDRVANSATRCSDAWLTAWNSGDWGTVAALFAPGALMIDRRSHVQLLDEDALETFRWLQQLQEPRYERVELVATRGDRLAMHRSAFVFRGGEDVGLSEIPLLVVSQVDDTRLRTHLVTFEPADLDAAYEELDSRHVALGGPDLGAYRRAFAARDWPAFRAQFADHFVCEDHRPTGWPRFDLDGYIENQQALVELAPDAHTALCHLLAASGPVRLIVVIASGTRDGGPFELPAVIVSTVTREGLLASWDFYAVDDLDTAEQHYDRMVRTASG